MSKKILICFCLTLCFLLTSCKDTNDDSVNYLQTDEITRYVIMKDDSGDYYKIYYYEIDSAIITVGDNNYDFEQAILTGALTLDEIFSEMQLYAELNDGGTEIYKNGDNKKYFDDSYTIIRCHTVDNNRDIYIGNSNFDYEEGFCKFKTTEAEIKLQNEIKKMDSTRKIIIKSTDKNSIIKTIVDDALIEKIIEMLSRSTESTLPVNSEGTNLLIQMFNENDKLLTSMSVWKSGYFGFEGGKEYFIDSLDKDLFNKMFES